MRENNAIIGQTREDKIIRLESLMDGILSKEDFLDEEFASLLHEHKVTVGSRFQEGNLTPLRKLSLTYNVAASKGHVSEPP